MPRYAFTTKKAFTQYFKDEVLPYVKEQYEQDGRIDYPARREAWNNTIDAMERNGELPPRAGNWCCPW